MAFRHSKAEMIVNSTGQMWQREVLSHPRQLVLSDHFTSFIEVLPFFNSELLLLTKVKLHILCLEYWPYRFIYFLEVILVHHSYLIWFIFLTLISCYYFCLNICLTNMKHWSLAILYMLLSVVTSTMFMFKSSVVKRKLCVAIYLSYICFAKPPKLAR